MPFCRNFQKNLQTAKKEKLAFHLNLFSKHDGSVDKRSTFTTKLPNEITKLGRKYFNFFFLPDGVPDDVRT
jgi:hypothetical protein